MEYKTLFFPKANTKKVLLIPGWNSVLPIVFIERLKRKYEVLVLLFSFAHFSYDKYLTIEDYVDIYNRALNELNYKPDIRIGHSFGGKILSFIPDNSKTYLIAPSCYKPLVSERILTKYKVFRNKMMKRILLVSKKQVPSKYLGSKDYQSTSGMKRKTFLSIKDAYPSISLWKKHKNIIVVAYKKDKSIPLFRVKKRYKEINIGSLNILNGDHYSFFEITSPILYLLEKER